MLLQQQQPQIPPPCGFHLDYYSGNWLYKNPIILQLIKVASSRLSLSRKLIEIEFKLHMQVSNKIKEYANVYHLPRGLVTKLKLIYSHVT